MKLAALVLLAACGAAPAETVRLPARAPRMPLDPPHHYVTVGPVAPEPGLRVAMPRPVFLVPTTIASLPRPDPSDHIRWPLTANNHPTLEPSYAIAPVFANPGVSWVDLCRMGAQNRRAGGLSDQLEYLRAWCETGRRDIDAAVRRLAPLQRSTVVGLPAAVRNDVANILVDAGSADDALRTLAGAHIDDVTVLDRLAASYGEVGKVADAATLNSVAIGAYGHKRPADQCERITRRILMAAPADRANMVTDFDPYLANRSCSRLRNEIDCWASHDCVGYLLDHGIAPDLSRAYNAYVLWPEDTADSETWWSLGSKAYLEIATPGADALAVAAFEATMQITGCRSQRHRAARGRIRAIKRDPAHDKALDERIDELLEPEGDCK